MKINFGKYRGTYVDELPDSYLQWLYFRDFLKQDMEQAVKSEAMNRWPDKFVVLRIPQRAETPTDFKTKVQSIFRRLANKYHPDHAGPDSTKAMQALNEFREMLGEVLK